MFKKEQINIGSGNSKKNPAPNTQINQIGCGTTIEGDIITEGALRVDGSVIGSVRSTSRVVLGESAVVDGDVISENAEIQGKVNGNVYATEQLQLKQTARIKGDLFTSKLLVEEGAVFNGKCNMSDNVNVPDTGPSIGQEKNFTKEKAIA